MQPHRLSNWPSVWVYAYCTVCPRRGRYRLARLAQRYGAEELMDNVLYDLSKDCPFQIAPHQRPRKYARRCHAQLSCDEPEPRK